MVWSLCNKGLGSRDTATPAESRNGLESPGMRGRSVRFGPIRRVVHVLQKEASTPATCVAADTTGRRPTSGAERKNARLAGGLMRSRGPGHRSLAAALLALAMAGVTARDAGAQQMVGPRLGSRAELTAMLDSLQAAAAGVRDGDRSREIQNQISGLGYRLREGDVWPGDVVDLVVTNEAKWTRQFTVSPNRKLELDDIEPVDLSSVLYSELEGAIALQLARYLREPRVRARVLKRIGILGQVGSPGFYVVEGTSLVSELVMTAGGPSGNADLDDVEFRRLGNKIELGRPRVAWQSLSIDQLGIHSGDEMFVPARPSSIGRILLAALGVAVSISFLVIRLF